jgi:hypothetical protein
MRRVARPSVALGLILALAFPAALLAQDGDGDGETPTPPPPTAPTFAGRDSATGPIGQLGATLELGSGFRVFFPPRLPIGNSRLLTLRTERRAPRPADIARGFIRQGPAVLFDGAINASRTPLEVSLRVRRLSPRRNMKLVLANEQAGLCTDTNRHLRLSSGLCSTWALIDAQHDAAGGRIVAPLGTPGGMHLVFGWVPAPPPPETPEPDQLDL